MKIRTRCKVQPINWAALPDLETRIQALGYEVDSVSIELPSFPHEITYESVAEAVAVVRKDGPPKHYSIRVRGESEDRSAFLYWVHRFRNNYDEERLILEIQVDGLVEVSDVENLSDFLGIESQEKQASSNLERTAFIGHRFDDTGTVCAEKLARFLELLGFSVTTGRSYAPGPVSVKVRDRLTAQALVFVILTSGTDDTWLLQESLLGEASDKPLFLIKDLRSDFTPGILADHEYIPFEAPVMESTFLSVLEGLKDLGYLGSSGEQSVAL